jgi:hypothetical protein
MILDEFKDVFLLGPALDYGCGQREFLKLANARSFDCYGCDLNTAPGNDAVKDERFEALSEPWSLPKNVEQFQTVILLDVFEHHPEPRQFIADLKKRNVRNLLVKVPIFGGPISMLARLSLQLGRKELMDRMILTGEYYPHQYFYTRKGLTQLMKKEGYHSAQILKLAEVGRELPRRLRTQPTKGKSLLSDLVLSVTGEALDQVSRVWADTAVFHFVS